MNIELKRTADIKPYEHNPRVNDGAVDAFARSIKEFGFRQPLVVDEDGVAVTPGQVVDHGRAYSLYFCDPYGNRIEITTYEYEAVGKPLRDRFGVGK